MRELSAVFAIIIVAMSLAGCGHRAALHCHEWLAPTV
jgi:predicted small lipoprotein YifL